MLHAKKAILALCCVLSIVSAFGGDDKFLKKYAMMKIYESCFGPEVIKQVRAEMKAACAKCAPASLSTPGPISGSPVIQQNDLSGYQLHQLKLHSPQALPGQLPNMEHMSQDEPKPMIQPNIDTEKLQQAILSFKQQSPLFHAQMHGAMQRPQHYANAAPLPLYSPWGGPVYPQAWGGPIPGPYSGYQAQPMPGAYYPQYYPGGRISRDMDFRDRPDLYASRAPPASAVSAGAHNITCVMQELGYLDENLEPNVEKIARRISGLPVHRDLKEDMLEGLDYCQKFSQCVPETRPDKSPLSRELIKPMFFFRCYKHKKLEACVMKDVRERFNSDDSFDSNFEEMRNGRSYQQEEPEVQFDPEMLFDFLYSGSSLDLDAF